MKVVSQQMHHLYVNQRGLVKTKKSPKSTQTLALKTHKTIRFTKPSPTTLKTLTKKSVYLTLTLIKQRFMRFHVDHANLAVFKQLCRMVILVVHLAQKVKLLQKMVSNKLALSVNLGLSLKKVSSFLNLKHSHQITTSPLTA